MHWTPEEQAKIDRVKNFREMSEHGLAMIERIKKEHNVPGVIQVCGPISTGGTGNIQMNTQMLLNAIATLHNEGLPVFNQVPFNVAMTRLAEEFTAKNEYCQAILDEFYRPLFRSGSIRILSFLPTWESSHGTKWERREALELDLEIFEYPHREEMATPGHFALMKKTLHNPRTRRKLSPDQHTVRLTQAELHTKVMDLER